MPPKRHLHKFDAVAVAANCSNNSNCNGNIYSSNSSSYTPTSPQSLHGNIVCCVCGLLQAASSCGSIKIFVASFSSSSLNSSRCKFLAVFCFSTRQAVCFVVVAVVVVTAGRAHLPGRGTDCFQSLLQFVVRLNLSQLVPKPLRL